MFNFTNKEGEKVQYRKPSSNTGNSTFRQTFMDRLVEVLEVHPSEGADGYLIAKDLRDGKKFHVTIEEKSYKNNSERAKVSQSGNNAVSKITGWKIDSKLDNEVASGQKYLFLQRTGYVKKNEVVDGEKLYYISTDWMRLCEDYLENKQFYGILTAYAYRPLVDEYVQSFQVWDEYAVNVLDSDKIAAEADKFTVIADTFKEIAADKASHPNQKRKYSYPAKRGFQLRAFEVTEKLNPETNTMEKVNTLLDMSYPVKNLDSKAIEGQWFLDQVSAYATYVVENYAKQKSDYTVTTDANGNQLLDENGQPTEEYVIPEYLVVEICFFTDYMCNNLGKSNILNPPDTKMPFKTEIQRMVEKETKPVTTAKPDEYYTGMNLAVFGIIDLSDNDYDKQAKREIEKDNVRRAYINGQKRNVHYMVKTTNGGRVIIPDTLRTEKELAAMQNATTHTTTQQTEQPVEFADEVIV